MGHRRIALLVGMFGSAFSSAQDLQPYLDQPLLAGPYAGIDKYIGARQALDEFHVEFDPELLGFIDLNRACEDVEIDVRLIIRQSSCFKKQA